MSDVNFEIRRQLVHLSGGVAVGLGAYFLMPRYGSFTALPVFLGILGFLILPKIASMLHIHRQLTKFEREDDIKQLPYKGAINYGIGVIPAILFLRHELAAAVIMILSVGDSLSTIVGKTLGRTPVGFESFDEFDRLLRKTVFYIPSFGKLLEKLKRTSRGYKTLEGFMGFVFGGIAGAIIVAKPSEAIFLSLIGAFIELLAPFDDNISIPWILTLVCLLLLP